ncbi:hypothetical protein CQW23_24600 [Capsicum baccatum]|uniref:HECT-type E3 ubiquitin transferase n=1 Tax=Capsicum baccatum TaxID=33114 RepID=A0A2G2VV80_CAPBA|nr:hypothetical protein CQW23_24600 [Capsicum baccatum]
MQLCEMLSIGTEDSLSTFSVYSFVPVLLGLLNHKNNPDIMLLAAWALTHVVDVLSSSCVVILHYRDISCFVARLLTIEYKDLAEQEFVVSWFLFDILLPQDCCQQISKSEMGPFVESGLSHGRSNYCPKVDRDIRHQSIDQTHSIY